ncbi:UNVERIFIED_CONTAM: Retrovirus-related Pol polyprotein from transposon RE2 [Sesamum angustifolium]|uniref:Retrovirus-related Pol polyprotein from transposon RE2 n=1 Tax=Sesamum angustifolium TaxID=2727405 RepID=A0AAW2LGH7_9LAMI
MQIAKNFNFEQDAVLFSRGKLNDSKRDANEKKVINHNSQSNSLSDVTCEDNDRDNEGDQLNWEQCFTMEVVEKSDNANIGSASNQTQINYANYKDEWIINSGCSHHVTGDDSLFSELRQHNGKRVIVTADNSTYPVAKEGAVKIDADETSVKLDDVYHVPGLKKNLISVSQITNSGKYVLFGPNDVKVLDNVKNVVADVILSDERKGSLFVISIGQAYVKKTSQTDSATTWHAGLSHNIEESSESPTLNRNASRREGDDSIVRRSLREKRKPVHLNDYKVQLNHCNITSCFIVGASSEEPECYGEAKGYLDWEAAMQDEIEVLRRYDTWELVPKSKHSQPDTCKSVYRLKKKSDGTIDRYKARLVARGFSQSYGLDYEETFSPVAKMVTIRSIFSLAASKSWKIWQLDVKNAFLYGELDREVLMEQPPGFVSKEFPRHVCLLKKGIIWP